MQTNIYHNIRVLVCLHLSAAVTIYPYVIGFEKRGHFAQNATFSLFNLPPFQGSESLGLQTWFVSSLDLLLHRSNVRTLRKPPVPSGEPPKRNIKRRFSNVSDVAARPAHTGSGWGPRFAASVAGWWKNIHTRFEVCSCYGSRDISVSKPKFGKCAKCPLFSNPVTYNIPSGVARVWQSVALATPIFIRLLHILSLCN